MRSRIMIFPVVALAVAALACAGGTPDPGESDGTLFEDDFSDRRSGWTTGVGESGSVDYVADEYAIKVGDSNWFIWGVPGESDLADIHIEVTAIDLGPATDAGFGIICHYVDDQNFYYLGIGSDGYYAIARFVDDEVTFLSDSEGWIESDGIALDAASYRLGADCGQGTLTLYVDGEAIDSVADDTFSSGDVGLFVLSASEPNAEVHFDDFVVTALE
jgi:hypothetical protein